MLKIKFVMFIFSIITLTVFLPLLIGGLVIIAFWIFSSPS